MGRATATSRTYPERSLTKKASLNFLTSGLEFCTRFVVTFIVTPFLVAGLGDILYGVWTVILKMTEYISAGGRSGQALKWFVVNRQASSDAVEKRTGVGGAVVAWFIFLPLQAGLGSIVAWYLPIWVDVPLEYVPGVRIAASLIVAGFVLRGLVDVPQSVLIGENLAYKRLWLSATLAVSGGGLTLLALHYQLGIVGVAAAALITIIATGLAFAVVVRFYVPWFGCALPDRSMVRQFVGWSWWFMLWDLVSRVIIASDVVLLGILASPKVVTLYAVVRYLPVGGLRLVTQLVYASVPGIGKVFAGGDLPRAARMRGEVMLLSWLVTTSVGATMLLWNTSFVQLWIGANYDVDPTTMLLIVLLAFQNVWIRADADFINLTLDIRRKVALGAVAATLSVLLAIGLIQWLDSPIMGVCLGFICGQLLLTIGYPVLVGSALQTPFRAQVLGAIVPTMVTFGSFAAMTKLSDYVHVDTWFGFALVAPLTFALVLLCVFFVGLSSQRRRVIWNRARVLLGGNRD